MKIILLYLMLVAITPALKAQYVSLSDEEIAKLKKIVTTEKAAATVFSLWETIANQSLIEKPNPIDTIESEGRLISYPKKQLSIQSFKDMNKVYALAISYRVKGKKEYLTKATDFISAWAKVNHSIGNPINDMKLDLLVEAYDLIRNEVPKNTKKIIDNWLTHIADEEMKTVNERYTNWNSHRLRIITQIAFILNKKRYIDYVEKGMQIQILKNLYANGSSLDIEQRDALHYHTYSLDPLMKASLIIKRATGKNYFNYVSPSGSSIKKSVDFLIPYAKGEKKYKEFVNSTVKIDRDRADQKEPGFEIGGYFNPTKTLDVFSYATFFDSSYAKIRDMLTVQKQNEPLTAGPIIIDTSIYSYWLPVLNDARLN